MDVTQKVDSIVEDLVRGIESRLAGRVEKAVNDFLNTQLASYDYEAKINWLASLKLDTMISQLEINKSSVEKRLDAVSDIVIKNVEAECKTLATSHVRNRLFNEIDVNQVVRDLVSAEVIKRMSTTQFPEHSIPGSAINPSGLQLKGDNINGGIVQNFSSTGIEDKSTTVQMTLLDEAVVVENKIVALGLNIQGTTVLDGDLVINGDVPPHSKFYASIIDNAVEGVKNSMDEAFFGDYSTVIFEKIKTEGLDLNRITLNGTEVIIGNKLNYGIVDTNITRLGMVKDLQTVGETYLSEHLYVGKDKVGIGTMEPGHSLTVWDQEVEIGFGKRLKDTGWIGTPRNQNLILSANNQDNLVIGADGSVQVKRLTVNKISIISSASVPTDIQPKATVAFNENPAPGQPIGWVSLGNGSWSSFGTIN
jgi:hypothetical protein